MQAIEGTSGSGVLGLPGPSGVTLLDHGYLEVVESWGSDRAIVEAARMSTQKEFGGWGPLHHAQCQSGEPISTCGCSKREGDERLLRFMYEHHHATPFEFGGLVIEVKAPIFVFREWHRHRTQSYSEASARYAPLPDENYLPTIERVVRGSRAAAETKNRQAMGVNAVVIDEAGAGEWLAKLDGYYATGEALYQEGLARGVPKELARCALTVARYTKMRAAANLRNWLAFATLRSAPEAQEEIRVYSRALVAELERMFPQTLALFATNGRAP